MELLGYHDRLWKPVMEFSYKGEPEEFTLQPGKYLLVCGGARGGRSFRYDLKSYGGISYGILDLKEPSKFYAVVGGDGEDFTPKNTPSAKGGYNGGGDGGLGYTGYANGPGGGGASDIRLNIEEDKIVTNTETFTMPDNFQRLTFIKSKGGQCINTGYTHKANTKIICDCEVYSRGKSYEAVFGARINDGLKNQMIFFSRFSETLTCYGRNTTEQTGQTFGEFGKRVSIIAEGSSVKWLIDNEVVGGIDNPDTPDDGKVPMLIFDLNRSNSVGGITNDESYTIAKIYSFRIYEGGQLVHCFVPCKTKNIELDFGDIELENGSIGSGGNSDSSSRVRSKGYIPLPPTGPRQFKINATDKDGNPLHLDVLTYDANGSLLQDIYWFPSGHTFYFDHRARSFRFIVRHEPEGSDSFPPNMVGSITFSHNEGEVGLCDVLDGSFHPDIISNDVSDTFECGDISEGPLEITDVYTEQASLSSRIIVAGGGGGVQGNEYANYTANGGGAFGGCVVSGNDDPNLYKYATQVNGFSFGQGMTPDQKIATPTCGAEGAGGGGGGWFGGYSSAHVNCKQASCNGGGGSGYVFTESSYKPEWMENNVNPKYYLTETTLSSGQATEAFIKIYKVTPAPDVGDTIVFPNIGRTEEMKLYQGKYEIECYGGDGGVRFLLSHTGRGGYTRGTLTNARMRKIYVTVGGSGMANGIRPPWPENYNPTMSFNGGGAAGRANTHFASAGGGASDVRFVDPDLPTEVGSSEYDSLLSRFIVAGGGGGEGANDYRGGAGGGESGVAGTGKYGTTPGPGTQTGTPQNSSYPTICGSFGKGGNGAYYSDGYGGAGGGGWFGGSGTYPDGGGDDDRGGCGGSGYVYTETSFKPDGYLVTSPDDYLTDTYMQTGGNNLPHGMSKIVITCNDIQSVLYLAQDEEGYKTFNASTNAWEYFYATELTPELFAEYGVLQVTSDQGLLNEYTIYAYNDINHTAKIGVYGSPYSPLRIKAYTNAEMAADRLSIDADYNADTCDMEVLGRRIGNGDDAKLMIDTYIKNKPVGEIIDIYCVHALSMMKKLSKTSRYIRPVDPNKIYEPEPGSGVISYEIGVDYVAGTWLMDPKTGRIYETIATFTSKSIEEDFRENYIRPKKKYLLPVGSSSDKQLSYRNYLGTYGDETITTIYCRLSTINRRMLYTLLDCTSSGGTRFVRIKAINMITSRTRLIADIPWASLGSNYHGGFLVDDNYGYITLSILPTGSSTGARVIYRFSLDNPSEITTYTFGVNDRRYRFDSYGKMLWKDKETIMLDTYNGCVEFNTRTRLFTEHYHSSKSSNRRDFCVGKRYFISFTNGNSTSAWVYDMIDNGWHELVEWCTLPVNAPGSITYDEDHHQFIFVQTGHITFVDEETMTIVKHIPTSWGVPKSVHYTNGFVFITVNDSPIMWVFDIKNDRFDAMYLAWTMSALGNSTITRPSVFKGYFFQPYWSLLVFTFKGAAKYNFGGKYSQYQILYDKPNLPNLVYDDKFVTVYDDFTEVHDGYVWKDTTDDVAEAEYQIIHASFSKKEYSQFINLKVENVSIDDVTPPEGEEEIT